MQTGRRTIYIGGSAEITVKKSRFIGECSHVRDEVEAEAYLASIKKKYYDARHHCSAYLVGGQNSASQQNSGSQIPVSKMETVRSSDDGEPGGSAGRPILAVLEGEQLHDTIIVVTRYFGGTLLGVGGLVRAYTEAAQAAVHASAVIEKFCGAELSISTDYTSSGKLLYQFEQNKIPVMSREYTERVTLKVLADERKLDMLMKNITEVTGGKAILTPGRRIDYANYEGEILTFPKEIK